MNFSTILKFITGFFIRHQKEIEKMILFIVQSIAEDAINKRKNKTTTTKV